MKMFEDVLVPVDGSEDGWRALQQAVWVTGENATLHGLYVVDVRLVEGPLAYTIAYGGVIPYTEPVEMDVSLEMADLLEKQGKKVLEEFARRCKESGRKCTTELRRGIISKEICEAAESRDLIVMGKRGEGAPWASFLLGSTYEAVVRAAKVPVLGVAGEARKIRKMLAAYDGSPRARDAIKYAAWFMESGDRELVVLVIGKPQRGEALLEEARQALKGVQGVRFVRRTGHAAETILSVAESEEVDLLLIGGYSRRRFISFLFGSTVEQVVRKAEMPVLVCR